MRVKICGVRDAEMVTAALEAGASYLGFVFFAKSPRSLSIGEARQLAPHAEGTTRVALVVNADDDLIGQIAASPIDMIQLHGTETPERVAEVKRLSGLPVMKAIGVADKDDLAAIDRYEDVADQLLIDAKPPKNGELPGGNGLAFDWRLVEGRTWSRPWMLAGGLTPDNVTEAVRLTGATQVDVSSGVESAPGVKDAALIRRFIEAAR